MKQTKGFTLLEILLVIAAIGILAAIVLVAINPNRQINQARQAVVNSEKNTIEKALQQALIDTGNYPIGLDGLQKKVCSNTVNTPDCVDLSELIPDYVAAIPSTTTYTVAKGNDGRVYINTAETSANFTCPTGYIPVPGNSLYQTKDFCVMKYEAKAVELTNPTVGLTEPNGSFLGVVSNIIDNSFTATTAVNGRAIASVASGYPIANIDHTTASQYCSDAGATLINNREWMTIARNIEAQPSNWFNSNTIPPENKVGSGGLYRGHSDNDPPNALAASTDENQGYIGTNNDVNNGWQERRTHTLSNGEVIWDLSGNVWEWVSDSIQGQDKPIPLSGGWQEWTTVSNYGNLSYDLIRPSDPNWNTSQNVGQYLAGTFIGNDIFKFRRGGHWNGSIRATVFTLRLDSDSFYTDSTIGFRCVVR